MTPEPVLLSEHETIARALLQMRRIGVRRLRVISEQGQPVGVRSLDDLLDLLADELQDVAGSICSAAPRALSRLSAGRRARRDIALHQAQACAARRDGCALPRKERPLVSR